MYTLLVYAHLRYVHTLVCTLMVWLVRIKGREDKTITRRPWTQLTGGRLK